VRASEEADQLIAFQEVVAILGDARQRRSEHRFGRERIRNCIRADLLAELVEGIDRCEGLAIEGAKDGMAVRVVAEAWGEEAATALGTFGFEKGHPGHRCKSG
jgi:hypothetical protein